MSNMYTYKVPFTEEELHHAYVIEGMSQAEIAVKFSTTQKVVWRAMKKMGVPTRIAKARNQAGEANQNWRGGRVLMATSGERRSYSDQGYWYIYAPNHPNVRKNGYVAEHIDVATKTANRSLEAGECVHHINLNKHDNSPDNLAICDKVKHAHWHQQLEEIAVALIQEGKVAFDSENGYRYIG